LGANACFTLDEFVTESSSGHALFAIFNFVLACTCGNCCAVRTFRYAVGRPDGTLSCCYRVTQNGLREYRCIHGIEAVEEQSDTPEKTPRLPRKKKDKKEPEVAAALE
jgi:hypothetical protein